MSKKKNGIVFYDVNYTITDNTTGERTEVTQSVPGHMLVYVMYEYITVRVMLYVVYKKIVRAIKGVF